MEFRTTIYRYILSKAAAGPWLVPKYSSLAELVGEGHKPNSVAQAISRMCRAGLIKKEKVEGRNIIRLTEQKEK